MALYEVTIELNSYTIGSTKIEAEHEDEAIEIVEAELDLTGLNLVLTGDISIGSDEFTIYMDYAPRDTDVEMNFGAFTFTAIELEA